MTNKKKSEPNPIEEAIGDRAIPKEKQAEPTPIPLEQIPDEPTATEAGDLETLNNQAIDRLQEQWPEPAKETQEPKSTIPVSKLILQPAITISSQESPPQKIKPTPAEDVELTALKEYILEDGFVLGTVAFHIVSLCADPMTTPSTTTWDFVDRAKVPDMVFALLNQPGYLEGIWPSLRMVMGSSKGNSAWCAGIATTIAFFDIVRVIPTLRELKNER